MAQAIHAVSVHVSIAVILVCLLIKFFIRNRCSAAQKKVVQEFSFSIMSLCITFTSGVAAVAYASVFYAFLMTLFWINFALSFDQALRLYYGVNEKPSCKEHRS